MMSNAARVLSMLDRITLASPLFNCITLEAYVLGGDVEIRAYIAELPERDTGKPIQGTTQLLLDSYQVKHAADLGDEALKDRLIHAVRKLLMTIMEHEMHEMLQFDGKLIKDPHVSDEPKTS